MVDRAIAEGFGLYGELAYGKRLDDDADSAEVRLASLPTNAYSAEDIDRGSDNYLRVDGGWRMQLGRNAMLHLGAGIETWDEVTARGEVGVSYTF